MIELQSIMKTAAARPPFFVRRVVFTAAGSGRLSTERF
jgi:hypothetical protein